MGSAERILSCLGAGDQAVRRLAGKVRPTVVSGTNGIRRAEKGLRDALKRLAGAQSEDDALNAFSESLNWVHRLEEAHKKRLGKARYFRERDGRSSGQLVGGLVYARGLDHHQLTEWADPEDVYSDVYTEMYSVLRWRGLAQVPEATPDKHGRESFYRSHLAGMPVPDTFLVGQRFLTQQVSQLS